MHILSARDYGFRKVFRVVEDDTIPQWLHPDGQPHTPDTSINADGDVSPRPLEPGTECHACRSNWKIHEVVITGSELINAASGEPLQRAELLAIIEREIVLRTRGPGTTIAELLGAEVT